MRRYSADQEERIRMQRLVRAWTRFGLLDAAQGERLAATVTVDLRRTNPFLRAGLALFTLLIVGATVGLIGVSLGLRDDSAIATLTAIAAVGCGLLADRLAGAYRCYRFGVEEALAVAAIAWLCVSGALLASSRVEAVVLGIAAAGGVLLYLRFGFVYAALGAMACAAAIPFQFLLPAAVQRLAAAAVLGSVFAAARPLRVKYRDDYPGDEYGIIQAAALAGVYAVLNVQLWAHFPVDGWFYAGTYAVIWILPPLGLWLGARDKDRALIDVGLALTIVTLATNKRYLGWPQHTWDPALLGGLLIAVALGVRRWLSNGRGGERGGFTAARLLEPDREALSMLTTASSLAHPVSAAGAAAPRHEPDPPAFGGGRSGGGGAGGSF